MDPLSAAASAASLAQLCGTIVSALKFIRDASNVDSAVHGLRVEIGTLGDVLSHVAETFGASPMQTSFQHKHETDIRQLLDQCHKTLKALNQIISSLEGTKGFAPKLSKQIKLNKVTQHITILKANIHSCTVMLQVSLMTLDITMNREHQASLDTRLQELSHAVRDVRNSLSRRDYQGFSGGPLQVDNPLVYDVENCLDSVEHEIKTGFKHPEAITISSSESLNETEHALPKGASEDRQDKISPKGIEDNKETLDWLRTKGFQTENWDASRLEAVRLAVREGQVAVVRGLVNQVSKTQARRALLANAMQLAISIPQVQILESLMNEDFGLSIDGLLESGRTPLIASIIDRKHQIVELLLVRGVDTEARCIKEITPLTHAVMARDQGIVQLLHRENAHIDATTWDWTPLHFAVDNGDRDMVELLLKNGADIEASCPRDFPQKKNTQSAELRKSVTVGSTDDVEPYCTPLFRASIKEEDMMVQLLLERGADPEAKNSGQATALICAAEEQFEEIVELLLRNRASVGAKDQWEWTPLHRAQVKKESEGVTQLLLVYKAEVDARCVKQRTPLHVAAEWGNTLTVPILLDHKADIEAKDCAGSTPLHVAIEYRQPEMVIKLVEHGADVTARNSEGHDALTAAIHVEKQRKCPEIITYLKELKEKNVQSGTGFREPYPLT